MKICIGCDHGGFLLKEQVKKYLENKYGQIIDMGCYSEERCDYPDFAKKVASAVQNHECDFGVLICTTGIGISITANKVPGIRCALCGDVTSARLTRLHNNANMLALGAGIVGTQLALDIVKMFLETEFSGEERHQRRINLIEAE